jgi:hypothetical protein
VRSFLVKIISAAPDPRFDTPLRKTNVKKTDSELAPNKRQATINLKVKLISKNFIGLVWSANVPINGPRKSAGKPYSAAAYPKVCGEASYANVSTVKIKMKSTQSVIELLNLTPHK